MALPNAMFSRAEYLRLERAATDNKSELLDGRPIAMAGASFAHVTIVGNLFLELNGRLRASGCTTAAGDLKVEVDDLNYLYPDLLVVCDTPIFADEIKDCLTNPLIIVEVLSPSTELYDRRSKLRKYQRVPSVHACILVAQDEALIELYERQADGSWRYTATVGRETSLSIQGVESPIPLSAIYDRVQFADTTSTV